MPMPGQMIDPALFAAFSMAMGMGGGPYGMMPGAGMPGSMGSLAMGMGMGGPAPPFPYGPPGVPPGGGFPSPYGMPGGGPPGWPQPGMPMPLMHPHAMVMPPHAAGGAQGGGQGGHGPVRRQPVGGGRGGGARQAPS